MQKPDQKSENGRSAQQNYQIGGDSIECPRDDNLTRKVKMSDIVKDHLWDVPDQMAPDLTKNDESGGNGENLSEGWKVVTLARKITKGLTQIEMRLQNIFLVNWRIW